MQRQANAPKHALTGQPRVGNGTSSAAHKLTDDKSRDVAQAPRLVVLDFDDDDAWPISTARPTPQPKAASSSGQGRPAAVVTVGAKRQLEPPGSNVVKKAKLTASAAPSSDPHPPAPQLPPARLKHVARKAPIPAAGRPSQREPPAQRSSGSGKAAPKTAAAPARSNQASRHACDAAPGPSSGAPTHLLTKRSRSVDSEVAAPNKQPTSSTRRLVICDDDDWDTPPAPAAVPRRAAAAAKARAPLLPNKPKYPAPQPTDTGAKAHNHDRSTPRQHRPAACKAGTLKPLEPSANAASPDTSAPCGPSCPPQQPAAQPPSAIKCTEPHQPQQQQHLPPPPQQQPEMKHITLVSASGTKLRFKMPKRTLEAALARHHSPSPSQPPSPIPSDLPSTSCPVSHPSTSCPVSAPSTVNSNDPATRQSPAPAACQPAAASHPSIPSRPAASDPGPAPTLTSPQRRPLSRASSGPHPKDRAATSKPHRTPLNSSPGDSHAAHPACAPTTASTHNHDVCPTIPPPCPALQQPLLANASPPPAPAKLVIVPFDCDPLPAPALPLTKPLPSQPHTTASMPLPGDACDSSRSRLSSSSCRSTSTTLSLPTSSRSLCSPHVPTPRPDLKPTLAPSATRQRPPLPSKRPPAGLARPVGSAPPTPAGPVQQQVAAAEPGTKPGHHVAPVARLVILEDDDDDAAPLAPPKALAARKPIPGRRPTCPKPSMAATSHKAPRLDAARGSQRDGSAAAAATTADRGGVGCSMRSNTAELAQPAGVTTYASTAAAHVALHGAETPKKLVSPPRQPAPLHTRPAKDDAKVAQGTCSALAACAAASVATSAAADGAAAAAAVAAPADAAPVKQQAQGYVSGIGDFADFLQDYLETEL